MSPVRHLPHALLATATAGILLACEGVVSGAGRSTPQSFNVPTSSALTTHPDVTITTTSLPGGVESAPYSSAVEATGGCTPYTWSLSSGSLPLGLTVTPSPDTTSYLISGTPTAAGNDTFAVQVIGCGGHSDTRSFTVQIKSASAPDGGAGGSGSCPTGANYLDLAHPATGGGAGSATLASLGITSCFFISAAGSDSNSGTDEGHPWLHAPGMPACSETCASTARAAGQGFIFRGGDTWHVSAGSPSTGGSWTWTQSGRSTSPIYLGVDFAWFSGASFTRPIINEDNPLTAEEPSTCTFADDGTNRIDLSHASYVIIDMLEEKGDCTSGVSGGNIFNLGAGTHNIAERLYIHGWSVASSAQDDNHVALGNGNGNPGDNTNRLLFNVIDGSDSTWGNVCTTPSCVATFGGNTHGGATMWAVNTCWDVEYNVIRHASQGMECGDASIVHDNLLEYLFNPSFGGRHGNVFEIAPSGNGELCTDFIAYNNVTRNTVEGVNWWIGCKNHYMFNNVWENSGHFPPDPNGLLLSPPGLTSSVVTAYLFNNTFQANAASGGPSNSATAAWAPGSTVTLGNNHIMDFTSISDFFATGNGNSVTRDDGSGNVFQTTSVANAQGYVMANNYAPVSSGDATVGEGIDQASNFCSAVAAFNTAAGTACLSATSGGVTEAAAWGGYRAEFPAIPESARQAPWDTGAYQFSKR
jgi:hypothetical protein